MLNERIEGLVKAAIERCRADGALAFEGEAAFEISTPREAAHGDFATNAALVLAPKCRKKPREVAEAIVRHIPTGKEITAVEVAGPGFINFRVAPLFYLEGLHAIAGAGPRFGAVDLGKGQKFQVEFVSANPTGPLHIGHGRGAVYGDVLGNIFRMAGYDVTKEYYVNDAGNQILTLGRSVWLRMRELHGETVAFPAECYQGHYIVDIARELLASKHRAKIEAMGESEAIDFCGDYAGTKILDEIKRDLAETGVIHDTYFSEHRLHTDACVESAILRLRERGHVFDEGGAVWFRSTAFGDDKDRVLKKSDGSFTYFAADIAYHKNKYERGFRRVIDVWGADHGGYVARIKACIAALGYDPTSFDAVLIQLVNLVRGGEVVSMSTRSATYETLEDVRKEVGRDVCRYFFLMRSHNAQLDFDLDLAKEQSTKNPVFYIQYAHARIASILRKAAEQGLVPGTAASVDLAQLDLPEEAKLARTLCEFPAAIACAATDLEPHQVSFYLLELARMFQAYYSRGRFDERYRVISEDRPRAAAKLYLLKNIQVVLQNALGILGISAPEQMSREEDDE